MVGFKTLRTIKMCWEIIPAHNYLIIGKTSEELGSREVSLY
jgi:hypothetical protein